MSTDFSVVTADFKQQGVWVCWGGGLFKTIWISAYAFKYEGVDRHGRSQAYLVFAKKKNETKKTGKKTENKKKEKRKDGEKANAQSYSRILFIRLSITIQFQSLTLVLANTMQNLANNESTMSDLHTYIQLHCPIVVFSFNSLLECTHW